MDTLETLIDRSELSFPDNRHELFVLFEKDEDVFTLRFVPPSVEVVVHYVDDDLALLVDSSTKEVVGMQIDRFEEVFVPKYKLLKNVWKFNSRVHNFGDVATLWEERKPMIAKAVVNASKPALGKDADRFEECFA